MSRHRRIVSMTFVLLFVTNLSTFAEESAAKSGNGIALWISDIHFHPFNGGQVLQLANDGSPGWQDHTKWGPLLAAMSANQTYSGEVDANDFLLKAVLDQAAVIAKSDKPDFILMTGDFLSHDFTNTYFNCSELPTELANVEMHNEFVRQTMAYIALIVSSRFPGIPVVAALGNNDAYCGDYDVRGDSKFLATTLATFRKSFLTSLSEDFQKLGGCYVTDIPGTRHQVAVLNSIPFLDQYPDSTTAGFVASSPDLQKACKGFAEIHPVDELDWFRNKIDGLRHRERFWLVGYGYLSPKHVRHGHESAGRL